MRFLLFILLTTEVTKKWMTRALNECDYTFNKNILTVFSYLSQFFFLYKFDQEHWRIGFVSIQLNILIYYIVTEKWGKMFLLVKLHIFLSSYAEQRFCLQSACCIVILSTGTNIFVVCLGISPAAAAEEKSGGFSHCLAKTSFKTSTVLYWRKSHQSRSTCCYSIFLGNEP